jgi:hypothetical protein
MPAARLFRLWTPVVMLLVSIVFIDSTRIAPSAPTAAAAHASPRATAGYQKK